MFVFYLKKKSIALHLLVGSIILYIHVLFISYWSLLFSSLIWLNIIWSKIWYQRVLNEAGYVPSNSEKYPLGGIVSAIENAFHATPSLACSNGAVKELYLCFNKDFKVRLCILCFLEIPLLELYLCFNKDFKTRERPITSIVTVVFTQESMIDSLKPTVLMCYCIRYFLLKFYWYFS